MLWIPWPRVPRTRLARPPIPACCQALRPPDLLNCRTRRVPRALRHLSSSSTEVPPPGLRISQIRLLNRA